MNDQTRNGRTHLPFLRWAGSKRKLLPVLSQYWSGQYTRYLEPFAGSACLFFHIAPKQALLGDLNSELIGTYREVKRSAEDVIDALSSFHAGRGQYYRIRALNPSLLSKSQRAARFIYLNRNCFNGLYRTNSNGRFNVPYGGIRSGSLPTQDALRDCSRLLKRATLYAGDFHSVLELAKEGDFVYLDPPYTVESRRVFKEYNPQTFGVSDLLRLRNWMNLLNKNNIAFLVSYADCREASYLQKGFRARLVRVQRSIAGFVGSRRHSREILISNV